MSQRLATCLLLGILLLPLTARGQDTNTIIATGEPNQLADHQLFLRTLSAEKNGHNLATGIPTILFPSPKHPWIAELSKAMRGLTH